MKREYYSPARGRISSTDSEGRQSFVPNGVITIGDSYWSDDARVLEPGQPPYVGKAAIREFVTASLKIPGFKIHWVSEKPVLSADGKMAYMLSDLETTAPA